MSNETNTTASREDAIVRTSLIGIGANMLLAAFKAIVGLAANSIAVILDAVNNLSDALSSVITILGAKYASKKPDKKHPLGHGRAEYLSATIVSALVLYAGFASLIESVKKIITPEKPDYTFLSLAIIAVAVVVKILLGTYVKKAGEKLNSASLVASGSDASFDAIISFSVLVSAIISMLFHINLEAWLGVVISGFIIKSGIEMLLETVDELLGARVDADTVRGIRQTILQNEPEVSGVYDVILHSYGPDKLIGSAHIEVPDTMSINELDSLERRIADRVAKEQGIFLVGIGIYSRNTGNDEAALIREQITKMITAHDGVLQVHGFKIDLETKSISFDVILDFEVEDRNALFMEIVSEVHEAFPDYQLVPTLDLDI
ncbi:MAG: cation transporter [Oscillospiraceae bacterium]|nr:cation transporter [Oscillospiraceae bacterium]